MSRTIVKMIKLIIFFPCMYNVLQTLAPIKLLMLLYQRVLLDQNSKMVLVVYLHNLNCCLNNYNIHNEKHERKHTIFTIYIKQICSNFTSYNRPFPFIDKNVLCICMNNRPNRNGHFQSTTKFSII